MLGFFSDLLSTAVESLDTTLKDTPAHQIILATAAAYFIYNQYHNPWLLRAFRTRNTQTPKQRVIDAVYGVARHLPPVQRYLEQELNKNLQSSRDKLAQQRSQMILEDQLPEKGKSAAEILAQFNVSLTDCQYDFTSIEDGDPRRTLVVRQGDGQDSGALYAVHPEELTQLLQIVYGQTALSNPMHDKWPRINAMQAEIIRWCQQLFNGSEEGYGLLTHGGTTSIIEAMSAYVIEARRRGIEHPEIVVPETAHAAFKKAAVLTGATLIVVPVDKKTGAVSAATMKSYISGNTAVIVGSAPSFMNGINDPIEELGRLAKRKKVPFHVDACLGGFLTAFLDTSAAPMDFRVPGVTSVSADLHKYGYCPKGTSVLLFSKDSPVLPIYAALNWQGGLYATPGILDGSTSGARVAEVYTTLAYYGRAKYKEIAEQIIQLRQRLQEKIISREIPTEELSIFAQPKWSILGFRSQTLNIHLIADELEKQGWKLNLLQNPNGFHLCLTHVHTLVKDFEETFVSDLCKAIATVKSYPADRKPSGNVKVYGAVGTMPTEVQREVCVQYQKARLSYQGPRLFDKAAEAPKPDMEVQHRTAHREDTAQHEESSLTAKA